MRKPDIARSVVEASPINRRLSKTGGLELPLRTLRPSKQRLAERVRSTMKDATPDSQSLNLFSWFEHWCPSGPHNTPAVHLAEGICCPTLTPLLEACSRHKGLSKMQPCIGKSQGVEQK